MARGSTNRSSTPSGALQVRLLGPAAWVRPGEAGVALERRDAGVLAWLALEGESPRASLLELLWPDAEPTHARGHFRQRLFRLRKACGADLVVGNEMLAIAPGVTVDVLDDAQSDAGSELLQGLDFSDCPQFSAWLVQQRAQRRSMRNQRLAELASACEREGRLAEAIGLAERLVALEPLLEHAHRRLMRLHYLRGDRAAAIAAFEHCEQVFKRELGARPGPETLALLETVEGATAAASPPARNVIPAAILRPPRMVGRERELAALDAAWRESAVPCVLGEAGIGKSRLLADFAAAFPATIVVAARPGDGAIPYAALARLLRALGDLRKAGLDPRVYRALGPVLPELAAASASATAVEGPVLQRAVEDVLLDANARGVTGVVVDDLHFADAATVELLQRLCAADRLASMRFAFAQRPAEGVEAVAAMRQSLLEAARLRAITLAPLDEPALAALVDSLALDGLDGARLAPLLRKHTGGNPMYVLETLKSLVLEGGPPQGRERLPLPTTVAGQIERRLRQLSAPALALARVAAIAGSDFDGELAAQVLKQRTIDLADPWAELEAAQVLRGEAFAHDLIFETTLATVPAAVARLLHAEVAAWMEPRSDRFAQIASHWAAAGQPAKAGTYWQRAAAAAHAASRRGEQAAFLEHAAAAFRDAGNVAAELDCLVPLLPALTYVDIGQRLHATIDRALALPLPPAQRLRVLLSVGFALQNSSDYPRAEALAREALQLSSDLGDPASAFYAARTLGVCLTASGRPREALVVFEQHRGWVEVHGTAENRAEFASDRSWPLLALGRLAEAHAAFEQAHAIALELDQAADLNVVLNFLASTELRMGQCRRALVRIEQAIRLHDRLGSVTATSLNDFLVLSIACERLGRYGDALAHAGHALKQFEGVGATRYADSARLLLMRLFVALGQPTRAVQVAAPMRVTDPAQAAPRQWLVEACLAAAAGANPREPYARLLGALGEHSGSTALNTRDVAVLECARWSDGARRLAELDALVSAAEERSQSGLLIAALARRAEADALHVERAATDIRRALALLADYEPEGIDRAELFIGAHRALGAAGDPVAARTALHQGVAWIESTASDFVPAEFRDSFLHRNPANRELLRAASRARLA